MKLVFVSLVLGLAMWTAAGQLAANAINDAFAPVIAKLERVQ